MSEKEKNDEILDRNVGELLRRRHEPPVISAAASARILSALEGRLARPEEKSSESADTSSAADRTGFLARLFARPLFAGLVAAAAAVAIIAGGVALNRSSEPTAIAVESTYENLQARPQRFELADGSVLTLRTGAQVRVTSRRAAVLVSGDALFDIAKDKVPFTIERPGGKSRVVVLGTRFVLSGDKASTLAAVIRGTVRLEGEGADLMLGAGEGGEIPEGGAPVRRPVPRLSHLVSWSRSARKRAEGKDPSASRRGNLIARFAGWDGQDYPLPVRDFTVDVHLDNQVARVAIDQTFFNEYPGQLEGIYSFTLPGDAAISRLAMYVDGKLMEAGIAERDRARRVYESIVYRRRDPALMEWMAGNEVKVRIFPLFGRQEKRILLSYTQSLERLYDDVQLTVPLPRLDRPVGKLSFNARLVGCAECEVVSTSHAIKSEASGRDLVVRFAAEEHTIEDDLLLTIRQPVARQRVVAQTDAAHELAIARVVPELDQPGAGGSRRARRWVVLHDTSASRSAIERAAQVHVADRLLDELDENDEYAVVAFDATVRRMREADNAFTSVANADRKAVHDFLARQGRDGVGYTDLGAGLRDAAELLSSAPKAADFEPFIVYLGDGVATGGEREPRALLDAVKGRAAVVSIAIGASQDSTILGLLASETGGMTSVFNPGEDLDWRVFDLVAALNTDRVTALRAELIGAPVVDTRGIFGTNHAEPPEIYLSRRELATGEELSIVTRTMGALPRAVRLTGVRAGAPWTLEVPIANAQSLSRGASYLPRLWARERIASLLADDEPATHKAAITALAMRHWLLTPHTSLLVLENDAAYAKYNVVRSSTEGWAAYKTPAKIKVVTEPLTAGVNLAKSNINALVFRAPFELFASQGMQYFRYRSSEGVGGLGFGLGSGVGRGFGRSSGLENEFIVGGGGSESQILPDATRESRRAAEIMPEEEDAEAGDDARPAAIDAIVTRSGFVDQDKSMSWQAPRWASGFDFADEKKKTGKSFGPSFHGHGQGLDVSGFPVNPLALHHSGDQRLRDLSALVPALYSAELDRERERLARTGQKADRQVVAPAAAAAIKRARGLAGQRLYSRAGETIRVDADGRFRLERHTFTSLREQLVYDGTSLVSIYPDLELAVRRQVGDAEPLLYEAELPFVLARPDRLARFYAIAGDAREVTLQAPKLPWKLVVRFDASGRMTSVSRADGAVVTALIEVEYSDDAVTVRRGQRSIRYAVQAADGAIALDVPGAATTVAMPLRHPAYVIAEIDRLPGSSADERRRLQRQLAASYAALNKTTELGVLAAKMAKAAPLSTGELVLVSGSLQSVDAATFARVVPRTVSPEALRDLFVASRRFGASNLGAFADVATDESWFGTIGLYRHVLALATQYNQRARAPELLASLEALLARGVGPELPYIAASMFGQYNQWSSPKQVARAWKLLGASLEGSWSLAARTQRARSLSSAGQNLESSAVWSEVVRVAIDSGMSVPIDYTTRSAFASSPRGEAGWLAFWATTRDKVLAGRDATQISSLLRVALTIGQHGDAARIATAATDRDLSTAQRLELVQLLSTYGQRDVAFSLFQPLQKTLVVDSAGPSDPGVFLLASQFAAERGDKLEAARLYNEALARSDESTSLSQLRGEYAHLIGLYHQGAALATGDARTRAVERLLEVAGQWRVLDPDNASIDNQVSTALFAVGDAGEAMRVLSTAIERHPMEGRSFETVANVLQAQGRLESALGMWKRAVEVEPENPTWLLRQAQAMVALGDITGAKKILETLASRRKSYHERFEWIVRQALEVRKQL